MLVPTDCDKGEHNELRSVKPDITKPIIKAASN